MQVEKNKSLLPFNTFGIDVKARYFSKISSESDLLNLADHEFFNKKNIVVIGGGSNLLLTKDLNVLILKNEILGINKINESDSHIELLIGAGENWHQLVLNCVENGYGGIENLSLIPGNVGAAPMQNIGAYGVEIKDCFLYLNALHIPTMEIHTFNNDDCNFGYRESVFKNKLKSQYIILNIAIKLTKNHTPNTSYGDIEKKLAELKISTATIKDVSNAVISIRRSKLPDPEKIGNSGSFFKNPIVDINLFENLLKKYPKIAHYKLNDNEVKLAAGWLIEYAGWKGKKINNYGVHEKQALVLVNYGGASGKDINELSNQIVDDIYHKFNVKLEKEVTVL